MEARLMVTETVLKEESRWYTQNEDNIAQKIFRYQLNSFPNEAQTDGNCTA